MIIEKFMTRNPVYITPNMSVTEAKAIMSKEKINKLPVLDKNNALVGIVTQKELLNVAPSVATTLDMYEISSLLAELKVEKIMNRKVISVEETETIEEAARIMADNGIGCLPVLNGSLLVGIITESDIFRVFVDMFGTRHKGVRVTFVLDEKPGELAKLTEKISEAGANIVSLVTAEGDNLTKKRLTVKLTNVDKATVEKIFSGATVEDIRS